MVKLKKCLLFIALGTLALNSIWAIGVTHAVEVDISCIPNPNPPPAITIDVNPATARVPVGGVVEWRISSSCEFLCGGPGAKWEIIIPVCPPLFPNGFNSGRVPATPDTVIKSPAVAGCPGQCKYTVKIYKPDGTLCATLDPWIVCEEDAIPTLTEWGMIIFGVVLIGFITYVFLRRRKVIGVRV